MSEAQAKASAWTDNDVVLDGSSQEGSPSQEVPVADPEAIVHIMKIISRDRVSRGGAKNSLAEVAESKERVEPSDKAKKPAEKMPPEDQMDEQPKSPRGLARLARGKASFSKKRIRIGSRVSEELEIFDGETEGRWDSDREIKVHTARSSDAMAKNSDVPDLPEPPQAIEVLPVEFVPVPDPGLDPILDSDLQEAKEKLRDFYKDMKLENKRLGQLSLELQSERAALDLEMTELEKMKSEGLKKTERVSLSIDDLGGQQHELRKQLEAVSRETKLLEEKRAEIEGVRRAVEDERLAVVRERVSVDGIVEGMARNREEIEGAQGQLRSQAEALAQTRIDIVEVKSQLAQASEIIGQREKDVKQEEIRLLAQKDQLQNRESELERKESDFLEHENSVAESLQQVEQAQGDIETKKVEYSSANAELTSAKDNLDSRMVEFGVEQAKMRSQFEAIDSQRGEIERIRRDQNTQQEALNTAKSSWEELRASQETALQSTRSEVVAEQASVAQQLFEVNQEVAMLSKSRESIEEERRLLADARALVDNDRKTLHQNATQGESLRLELSTLRVEFEETKARLLEETSRRAHAEQGRQFAETYRPPTSKDSSQNLFDDPLLARLLDQQWDLWLTDDHK
jgi:hypothetical protein